MNEKEERFVYELKKRFYAERDYYFDLYLFNIIDEVAIKYLYKKELRSSEPFNSEENESNIGSDLCKENKSGTASLHTRGRNEVQI